MPPIGAMASRARLGNQPMLLVCTLLRRFPWLPILHKHLSLSGLC